MKKVHQADSVRRCPGAKLGAIYGLRDDLDAVENAQRQEEINQAVTRAFPGRT
jgi:hypothetical protein